MLLHWKPWWSSLSFRSFWRCDVLLFGWKKSAERKRDDEKFSSVGRKSGIDELGGRLMERWIRRIFVLSRRRSVRLRWRKKFHFPEVSFRFQSAENFHVERKRSIEFDFLEKFGEKIFFPRRKFGNFADRHVEPFDEFFFRLVEIRVSNGKFSSRRFSDFSFGEIFRFRRFETKRNFDVGQKRDETLRSRQISNRIGRRFDVRRSKHFSRFGRPSKNRKNLDGKFFFDRNFDSKRSVATNQKFLFDRRFFSLSLWRRRNFGFFRCRRRKFSARKIFDFLPVRRKNSRRIRGTTSLFSLRFSSNEMRQNRFRCWKLWFFSSKFFSVRTKILFSARPRKFSAILRFRQRKIYSQNLSRSESRKFHRNSSRQNFTSNRKENFRSENSSIRRTGRKVRFVEKCFSSSKRKILFFRRNPSVLPLFEHSMWYNCHDESPTSTWTNKFSFLLSINFVWKNADSMRQFVKSLLSLGKLIPRHVDRNTANSIDGKFSSFSNVHFAPSGF